ncbi:hypothetical protein [Tsukamurella sp. PLM1]|uniref:hypothetical protein n=1 Tax=Tsukamurella sp. PLM1 TaxID=2929795 RepID=UPI0020BDADD9|nr:hypothetical protein [Tsukamurella sp. PLM1]
MRRTVQTRSLRRRAAIAAVPAAAGLVLAACGGGGEEAASSSTPPAPVDEAKGLTQQDLPAGLTVSTVESENALMTALQSVQQVQDSAIEPAACKDKNVAAQQEVAETVKSGVQQTVAKGQTVLYGVTLLPGDVKPAVFEAAGTGSAPPSPSAARSSRPPSARTCRPGPTGPRDSCSRSAVRPATGRRSRRRRTSPRAASPPW